MKGATKDKPAAFWSGYCGLRLPAESHARRPGGFGELACSCACHQTCAACGQSLPAVQS